MMVYVDEATVCSESRHIEEREYRYFALVLLNTRDKDSVSKTDQQSKNAAQSVSENFDQAHNKGQDWRAFADSIVIIKVAYIEDTLHKRYPQD